MRHPYLKMGLGIYISYLLLGMVNIILASNMSFLSVHLNVQPTDISILISVVGIGHLLSINIAGKLSDRYGRKPLIVTAGLFYSVFLIGIPLTSHFQLAIIFALFAGVSNSLLDSGSYPAINEAFTEAPGTATVLLKAFMSIGAALLPLLITFVISSKLFFGYAFFIPAMMFVLIVSFLLKVKFPNHTTELKDSVKDRIEQNEQGKVNASFSREGFMLILIGFFAVSLSSVIQTWLPTYGEEILKLNVKNAVELLSFYGIGGLISILLLAFLLKRIVKPITAMILTPALASVFLLLLLLNHSQSVVFILSFFLGLFTSGIYQLAMTVMIELFPENKGVSTSYVSAAASVSFIVVPFVTGLLAKHWGITYVFIFDLGFAIISTALGLYLARKIRILSSSASNGKGNC